MIDRDDADPIILWHPDVPFPDPAELATPAGSTAVVVHRADGDYAFLHDCQIIAYRDTLFAAWYNCPRKEMEEASLIRGRCSWDGGHTWSASIEIARAPDDAFMYVPNVFGVHDGTLWCFALRMGESDRKLDGLDVFRLDDGADHAWQPTAHLDMDFLPNHPPLQLADGRAVMAGRTPAAKGDRPLVPAVAISREADWCAPWELRPLLPPGMTLPCPETTLLVEDDTWTAIIRPGDWVRGNPGRTALVSTSIDSGLTWSPPAPSNLPMQPSKGFAGTLSTGQRFLVANSPGPGDGGRDVLTLAVTAPGENLFRRMWSLQSGPDPDLGCGPEWSYPCAIETDGTLHVIYTSEKHHSVLRCIPVTALAV